MIRIYIGPDDEMFQTEGFQRYIDHYVMKYSPGQILWFTVDRDNREDNFSYMQVLRTKDGYRLFEDRSQAEAWAVLNCLEFNTYSNSIVGYKSTEW